MPNVLQQIAQQLENIDPEKAKELHRIDEVYASFGLNDTIAAHAGEGDGAANHLLHYLPRMARMRNFRLYRIGVGEQMNGGYAHQAVALLDARHLPTPGNTLAVLDPADTMVADPLHSVDGLHQYSFEDWLNLQTCYGHGCALIPDRQSSFARP
ncbi:MAG: hypothetical protein U1F42_00045 [Candidatus Competibacteraceae bacterium]